MLPALRCQNARSFDHLFSGIFNTPSYFQHLFLPCASTLFQHLFSHAFLLYSSVECVHFHHRVPLVVRASLLYSSTVRVRSGAVFQHCLRAFPLSGIGSCARVPTLFYHVCLVKLRLMHAFLLCFNIFCTFSACISIASQHFLCRTQCWNTV